MVSFRKFLICKARKFSDADAELKTNEQGAEKNLS